MPPSSISRRTFLKVCVTGGASTLLAACGKLFNKKGIQPLVPVNQPKDNLLVDATASPVTKGVDIGTPSANTSLPPHWTRGKVARERTLIYNGTGGDYPNCNPFSGGGQLLEGCAYYSTTADKTIFWMLESYQFSGDATELTLKFRPGIEWSDGKPFTSRDAQFGFETALRLGWTDITGVEVIDNMTMKVKLAKSDWRFLQNLVYSGFRGNQRLIVPEHIFKYITDQQIQSMIENSAADLFTFFDPERNYPVVTGPYMMVETDPAISKEFNYVGLNVLDLRPDWWAVKTGLVAKMPDVERIITVVLEKTPEMQVKQFAENIVDYCDSYLVDPDAIRTILLKADQVSTWTGDQPPYGHVSPDVGGLGFNTRHPPFDDSRVRWAIAYALDPRNLLDKVYGRDVQVAQSPFPSYPAFQKLMEAISTLAGEYDFREYNPAKSEQLMQQAGYQKGADGFWVDKNGVHISTTLYADGVNTWYYSTPYPELANAMIVQLRQAGFDCQVKLFEDNPQSVANAGGAELVDTWTTAAKGQASLFILGNLGTGINDPIDLFNLYQDIPSTQDIWSNVTRWVDADFTKVRAELNALSPEDPRAVAAFRKCMEIWYKNLPFIPLFQSYNRVPYSTRYWQNWPSVENPYVPISFMNLDALMLVTNLKPQI